MEAFPQAGSPSGPPPSLISSPGTLSSLNSRLNCALKSHANLARKLTRKTIFVDTTFVFNVNEQQGAEVTVFCQTDEPYQHTIEIGALQQPSTDGGGGKTRAEDGQQRVRKRPIPVNASLTSAVPE